MYFCSSVIKWYNLTIFKHALSLTNTIKTFKGAHAFKYEMCFHNSLYAQNQMHKCLTHVHILKLSLYPNTWNLTISIDTLFIFSHKLLCHSPKPMSRITESCMVHVIENTLPRVKKKEAPCETDFKNVK